MIDRLVLVGATGDLARRHLIPGLARLAAAGLLPERFDLVGVGRRDLSREAFRDLVRTSLGTASDPVPTSVRDRIVTASAYVRHSPGAPGQRRSTSLGSVLQAQPALVYLALPPWAFHSAIDAVIASGIAPGSGIVIEKPFGVDGSSAAALNRLLASAFAERHVHRADHVLHHSAVRALVRFRFATGTFEEAWNAGHVESVRVTWYEAAGLAGREDYLDRTGTLRDMVQSHLLEVLSLILMRRPDTGAEGLRMARTAALRTITTPTRQDVASGTRRARVVQDPHAGTPPKPRGSTSGQPLASETFASVELRSDDPRWAGVPLILSAGKAIRSNRRAVEIRFRTDRTGHGPLARAIRFEMPTGPFLVDRGDGLGYRPHQLNASSAPALPASARLLLDALRGDGGWFLGPDEPLEGWRIVEPILDGWREDLVPLSAYRPGGDELLLSS